MFSVLLLYLSHKDKYHIIGMYKALQIQMLI